MEQKLETVLLARDRRLRIPGNVRQAHQPQHVSGARRLFAERLACGPASITSVGSGCSAKPEIVPCAWIGYLSTSPKPCSGYSLRRHSIGEPSARRAWRRSRAEPVSASAPFTATSRRWPRSGLWDRHLRAARPSRAAGERYSLSTWRGGRHVTCEVAVTPVLVAVIACAPDPAGRDKTLRVIEVRAGMNREPDPVPVVDSA
jgi:hypothetical protein